ncbi:MAG: pitrilysin family protein [Pseudomonadota bacterium]
MPTSHISRVMSLFAGLTILLLLIAPERAKGGEFFEGELFPNVEAFRLDNGMDVVVIPDNRSPLVTHMVWYRVGGADEETGKSGLAHFLEHLLFKGTEKFPGNAIDRNVKRIGGTHNAFTAYDATAYFQRVTREHLGLLMEIEADRMMNVRIDPEEFRVERKVVLEERARSIETRPGSKLNAAMSNALFKNHTYGRPLIGWRHEIEALTLEDAYAFYERYYTPANAILVVAGDVTVDGVRDLAEKTYGNVQNRSAKAVRSRPQEPNEVFGRQLITVSDEQVTRESLVVSFRVPSYYTGEAGVSEALVLLSEVLSGSQRSRINRDLVVERQLATSAGAGYSPNSLNDTQFSLYGTPKGDVTLEELEGELMGAIRKIADEGVTADELERAKRRLFAATIYAQDSAGSLARLFGQAFTNGASLEDIRSWPERIKAVTSEDIKAAAATYFAPERAVVGHLRPPASGESGDPS